MRFVREILGLLIFVCVVGSSAIAHDYPMRHYTVADGLPSSEVYHVFQDSKGFIWFATDMGVARFDGNEYVVYDVTNGLLDNTVFDIFEDSAGKLWFVSMSGKLCYYIDGRIEAYRFNDQIGISFSNERITEKNSFFVDSLGQVSYLSRSEGLKVISPLGGIRTIDTTIFPYQCSWLIVDFNWRPAVPICVDSYYEDIFMFVSEIDTTHQIIDSPNLEFPCSCVEWNDKYIILAGKYLYLADSNSVIYSHKMDHRIFYCSKPIDNYVWIGLENGGAKYLNLSTGCFDEEMSTLGNKSVSSILVDDEKGVWFSTLSDGIYYLSPPYSRLAKSSLNLPKKSIRNLEYGKDSSVFIGYWDSYYSILFNDTIVNYSSNLDREELFLSFFYDSVNKMNWIGGSSSIFRQQPYIDSPPIIDPTIPNKHIRGFGQKPGDSIVYAAITTGVIAFSSHGLEYYSAKKTGAKIRFESICYDFDRDIFWVGSVNGLLSFDSKTGIFDTIDSPALKFKISQLKYTEQGLWIGTMGNGLWLLNEDTLFRIDENDFRIGGFINDLFLYEGVLWVSSNNGVFLISEINREKVRIVKIPIQTDLISGSVYGIVRFKDHFLVATNSGLYDYYYTDNILHQITPPLYITGVNINLHDVEFRPQYLLSHNENNIKFKFSTLSYINPGQQKYFYRLTGIDDQWQSTKNTEVVYHNLPPGNFVFEVKYRSDSDPDTNSFASISLNIKKPFWKTIWFIIVLVLVTIGVTLAFIYQKIANVKMEATRREEMLDARQKALMNQINPHFIFNSLNSIQLYILDNNVVMSSLYLSKFARLIRSALDKSQLNKVTLHEELELNHLYLEMEKLRFKEKLSYVFIDHLNINTGKILLPPFLIQPLLENALWHGIMTKTDEQGKITIELNRDEDSLIITITDNGIGRKAAKEQREKKNLSHKPIGMSISRRRLLLLSQQFDKKYQVYYTDVFKEDGTPAGTKVTLIVPLEIAES